MLKMKKINFSILLLFTISISSYSQIKDSLILFEDSSKHIRFHYSSNYILKNTFSFDYFLREKTDDSLHWKIDIFIERNYGWGKKFKDYIKEICSSYFDAAGMNNIITGESIDSIRDFKNKSNIEIIEIYENVTWTIYHSQKNEEIKTIQGPVYFIDLPSKESFIFFKPGNIDDGKNYNDNKTIQALKQIIDTFEYINN